MNDNKKTEIRKQETTQNRKVGLANKQRNLLPATSYLLSILLLATYYLLVVSCFDGNYIIRHITDPLFDKAFTVTVINGSGGGEYKEGDTVTITANAPSTGQEFKNWSVNSGGVTLDNPASTTATFTMPKNDVRITANFDTLPGYYTLTVTNGTISGGGTSGAYTAGTSVNIVASTPPAGQQFKEWTTNNGGTFGNANNASTTFTMPSSDVTVTAVFDNDTVTLTDITASYTGTSTIYATTSLDLLKNFLTVTANYSDSSTVTLSDVAYTLSSGTLTVGSNSITVTYLSDPTKTTTFPVTVSTTPYNVGDEGPGGGKIFYFDPIGFIVQMVNPADNYIAHYLEAAPADMPTTLHWASTGFASTIITGTNFYIGDGRKNTAIILNADASAPAASACVNYGAPNDWFLPSRDELLEYFKSGVIGVPTSGNYWSSTHYTSSDARYVSFDGTHNFTYKLTANNVRAIRAF